MQILQQAMVPRNKTNRALVTPQGVLCEVLA